MVVGSESKGRGRLCPTVMPIKQYLLWVGGALLCLMFVLDAYLPKAAPREDYDFGRTGLKISAPDTGIAPDTGAIAISVDTTRDEAKEPPPVEKITAPSAARALARLETEPPKKQQRKRVARAQNSKPIDRPVPRQYAWSSEWSPDWSPSWSSRAPISDAPRFNAMREPTKKATRYSRSGKADSNSAGRNSCWFC